GLVAWGETPEEAFAAAARALVAVTYDPRTIVLREERAIAVQADRPDRLLVRFLGEIVYLIDAEGFVPGRARVRIDGDRLTATLPGRVSSRARWQRTKRPGSISSQEGARFLQTSSANWQRGWK